MKLVATKTETLYLVEFDQDDVEELTEEGKKDLAFVEGQPNPRMWVTSRGLHNLIATCLGQEESNDFYKMLEQLQCKKN